MPLNDVFTFARLMLEAQRKEIDPATAKQALENAVMAGIFTVIGITDDGDFIYRKVPRDDRHPLVEI